TGDNLQAAAGTLHFAGGSAVASVTQTAGSVSASAIDLGGPAGSYTLSGGTFSTSLLPAGAFSILGSGRVNVVGGTLTVGDGSNAASLAIASPAAIVTTPILRLNPSSTVSVS